MNWIAVDSLGQLWALFQVDWVGSLSHCVDLATGKDSIEGRLVTKRFLHQFTEFRNKTEISDMKIAQDRPKSELLRQAMTRLLMASSLLESDRKSNKDRQADG